MDGEVLKRDYIIKTYNKGKKRFFISYILYALLTSSQIMLGIDITIILKEGYSSLKSITYATLIAIPSFVFLAILFIPEKWNGIVEKYSKLEKK